MKLQDFDFRIWDNSTNKFIEFAISDNIRAIPRKNDDLVLELWSGVCDKRGVRIYEGDVIECEAKIAGLYKKVRGSVIFKDRCFYVLVNKDIYKLNTLSNIELLGNIHEKKELLKDWNEKNVWTRKSKSVNFKRN